MIFYTYIKNKLLDCKMNTNATDHLHHHFKYHLFDYLGDLLSKGSWKIFHFSYCRLVQVL